MVTARESIKRILGERYFISFAVALARAAYIFTPPPAAHLAPKLQQQPSLLHSDIFSTFFHYKSLSRVICHGMVSSPRCIKGIQQNGNFVQFGPLGGIQKVATHITIFGKEKKGNFIQ